MTFCAKSRTGCCFNKASRSLDSPEGGSSIAGRKGDREEITILSDEEGLCESFKRCFGPTLGLTITLMPGKQLESAVTTMASCTKDVARQNREAEYRRDSHGGWRDGSSWVYVMPHG